VTKRHQHRGIGDAGSVVPDDQDRFPVPIGQIDPDFLRAGAPRVL